MNHRQILSKLIKGLVVSEENSYRDRFMFTSKKTAFDIAWDKATVNTPQMTVSVNPRSVNGITLDKEGLRIQVGSKGLVSIPAFYMELRT